jgi:hypothetical protein
MADWKRTTTGTWSAGGWYAARGKEGWSLYRDDGGDYPEGGYGPFRRIEDAVITAERLMALEAENARLRSAAVELFDATGGPRCERLEQYQERIEAARDVLRAVLAGKAEG